MALVAVTDEIRGGDPLVLARRLPRGSTVIFRHYGAPDRSVLAMKLAVICRVNRLTLLVAGDPALAIKARAGLHLPDGLARAPSPLIRGWKRRGAPLTAAAHDRAGVIRAARLGCDAVLLSPVFATLSHPGAKPLGLLAFRRLAHGAKLGVIALGGIDRTSVLALRNTAAVGVAALGALSLARGDARSGR